METAALAEARTGLAREIAVNPYLSLIARAIEHFLDLSVENVP